MSMIISIAPKRPAYVSAKLRCAVAVMVEEGATITASVERAGLTRQGLTKALKRPEVRAHAEAEKARFVAETDGKRALYKARALDVALDLLQNTKSESVLPAAGRAAAEGPQPTGADIQHPVQPIHRKSPSLFFDEPEPHGFRLAKNRVAFLGCPSPP